MITSLYFRMTLLFRSAISVSFRRDQIPLRLYAVRPVCEDFRRKYASCFGQEPGSWRKSCDVIRSQTVTNKTAQHHLTYCRRKALTKNFQFRYTDSACTNTRNYSTKSLLQSEYVDNIDCSNDETRREISKDMQVISDFVTEEEEKLLFEEVEPHLKRLRYESSHWDDAIHSYREIERKVWSECNKQIIQRVRNVAFPPGTPHLAYVHVLDLKKEGYIKPHVDAVKFCGSTIAGISLLSPAVMRLVHTDDKTKVADILLPRRSLYIMKDVARYNYTHEVLSQEKSTFKEKTIIKDRRISVICRNEPR